MKKNKVTGLPRATVKLALARQSGSQQNRRWTARRAKNRSKRKNIIIPSTAFRLSPIRCF